MSRTKLIVATLLALVLLTIFATPALAFQGTLPDGQVVFGEDYTLEAGETLDGDLVVFGGNVELVAGSHVNGDVVVWGGNAEVAGTIHGDLAALGGSVTLRSSAVLDGDLVSAGGSIDREEGADVNGEEISLDDTHLNWGPIPPLWWWGDEGIQIEPSWDWEIGSLISSGLVKLGQGIALTLLMSLLGGCVAVLWPKQAARTGRTAVSSLLPSLGVGLATILVVAIVGLVLICTICLLPVGVAAIVATGVAAVFGWTALGIMIGEKVLGSMRTRPASPFWSAALGTAMLTLISSLLYLIPCVGGIGGFVVACVALGAAVLTRLGGQEYALRPALPAVSEEGAE